MKLKKMSLFLLIALCLTACSNSVLTTKGAVERSFEAGETEKISQEHNGYSTDFTIKTWRGRQTDNKLWLHPADNNYCIPAYDTTACVIQNAVNEKSSLIERARNARQQAADNIARNGTQDIHGQEIARQFTSIYGLTDEEYNLDYDMSIPLYTK